MHGIDHSSCNWDGDDVVDGCPALIIAFKKEKLSQHMKDRLTKLNLILLKTFRDKSVSINKP